MRKHSLVYVLTLILLPGGASVSGLAGCQKDTHALLLTVTAESRVDSYVLRVLTPDNETLFETPQEPVDVDNPLRDISLPEEALRLALEFDGPGTYVIHLVGYSLGPVQVWTGRVEVNKVTKISATLTPLISADGDRDTFVSQEDCDALADTGLVCDVVDCDDENDSVYPGAPEKCGNGIDENCDDVDEPCTDSDGDGYTSDVDCDDENPEIYPGSPEPANGCTGVSIQLCDNGVDENCDGEDTICITDADCDESAPPYDCDDTVNTVYPGAPEICGNDTDDNCNGEIDEGCVPCDLDGDGFERSDEGCYPLPEDTDCNDTDSGISPGVTSDCEGNEGTPPCPARGMCDGRDNDCDGQVDEGCPPPECDYDGDGFMHVDVANGCDPAPGYEDCSDADASFYPGAPDICGDGLLQNCNTDLPCSDDLDGDGYNSVDGDCDDDASTIHPGAMELCDGVDNDCDGLVDEGNPDAVTGAPIPADAFCTLSDTGRCGDPAGGGRCICSRLLPPAIATPGNRTDCTAYGLDLAAAAPRCFYAPVPEVERCDATDWDCDGEADSPNGLTPLVEMGQPCGIDTGHCEPGSVVGCNLNISNPDTFNPHFVCNAYVGPTAEICNGFDDDCDGVLPLDEEDPDNDGYLECTGCDPANMSLGLIGCNDCGPNNASRNPAAPEVCNDVDDDCDGDPTDDGANDCPGGSCCPGYGCADLQTDAYNCGTCGNACNWHEVNACVNGVCGCDTGPACLPGQICQSGNCVCEAVLCGGCCYHNSCVRIYEQDDEHCGTGGGLCDNCTAIGQSCEWNDCN